MKDTYLYWKQQWLDRIALPAVDKKMANKASHRFNDTVLIVKLDAIGDYILFRQYLPFLVNHFKQQGKEVHLLGNQIWKGICEELDAHLFDKVTYINRLDFTRKPAYRENIFESMLHERYETVVHTSYHRLFWIDSISKVLQPKNSYASSGGNLNMTLQELAKSAEWHTKISYADPVIKHEFLRGAEFTEGILGTPCILHYQFPKLEKKLKVNLPPHYIVIFCGAGAEMRKWPVARYAEIAEWFIDHGFEIVLPGAEADAAMCQEILNKISTEHQSKVHNIAGKTNLVETASLIGKAQLVFGNETGFVHAAIGMDIPTVCLAGTHHIGYFVPYPKMLRKNLITLTAANQSADYKEENWEHLQKMQANFPVQGISLEQAKEASSTLLKQITVTQ